MCICTQTCTATDASSKTIEVCHVPEEQWAEGLGTLASDTWMKDRWID